VIKIRRTPTQISFIIKRSRKKSHTKLYQQRVKKLVRKARLSTLVAVQRMLEETADA